MSDPEQDFFDRRQNFRIDMEQETVDLLWRDEEGQSHKVTSVCADFSKGGLRIEHDFCIPEDSQVNFKFQADHPESRSITAQVIRCFELPSGCFSIALKII